jgi:predicted RNA binding protein YcfA (HicA-like mRNA interferase family)
LRRLLKRLGCVEVRQRGAHLFVRCGRCSTVIPVHTGDLPPGTLRAIDADLALCLGEGWLER